MGRPTRKAERAHRLSWAIHYGPIPVGLFVCHKCDNRKCVRPDHLFLGTAKDNLSDMGRKGRQFLQICPERRRRGVDHFNSKLNDSMVIEMRQLRENGWTLTKLGEKFGIHFSTVHDVVKRKIWTHV
jgi:hypothetical protein